MPSANTVYMVNEADMTPQLLRISYGLSTQMSNYVASVITNAIQTCASTYAYLDGVCISKN